MDKAKPGYILSSKAWWNKNGSLFKGKEYVDEIIVANFYRNGETEGGEIIFRWYILNGTQATPCLEVFSDGFKTLSKFKVLLKVLPELDSVDFTPMEFSQILWDQGFEDCTPYTE